MKTKRKRKQYAFAYATYIHLRLFLIYLYIITMANHEVMDAQGEVLTALSKIELELSNLTALVNDTEAGGSAGSYNSQAKKSERTKLIAIVKRSLKEGGGRVRELGRVIQQKIDDPTLLSVQQRQKDEYEQKLATFQTDFDTLVERHKNGGKTKAEGGGGGGGG